MALFLLLPIIHPTYSQAAGALPVADEKVVLTVSGGGRHYREVYESGEQPALSGYDSSGQQLPDGEYRYQLRSIPADSVSTNTQQGFLSGKSISKNTGKTSSSTVQSGRFDVEGGSVIYH